jgi:hypothetical protein
MDHGYFHGIISSQIFMNTFALRLKKTIFSKYTIPS